MRGAVESVKANKTKVVQYLNLAATLCIFAASIIGVYHGAKFIHLWPPATWVHLILALYIMCVQVLMQPSVHV